ncbi:MAG: hypothetical protein CVT95_08850 [Bacteroidetes bacterium HGW-Bacteroidetes-12]|jgi:hypothetical protein|nr:MAG: hypothetical protein CVT95_08850 [Bacteroidetes bacterium HGW-Bacteroidetes-12]
MKKMYIEKQRLNQWWVLSIIIILTIIALSLLATSIYDNLFNEKKMDLEDYFIPILIIGLCGFIWSIRLITMIDDKGISVNFYPFINEFHPWDKIDSVESVQHKTINKGMRWSSKYGLSYSIKGNSGILIKYKSGETFYIGSANPKVLIEEMSNYK